MKWSKGKETSAYALSAIVALAIEWFLSWIIVRLILIPSVEAIWKVALPFWLTMGLIFVIIFIVSVGVFAMKGE